MCCAAGCQRFEVVAQPGGELRWRVRVLADGPTPRVPAQARAGAAAWAPWAWAQADAWALADAARALFAEIAPEVLPWKPYKYPITRRTLQAACSESSNAPPAIRMAVSTLNLQVGAWQSCRDG